MKPTRSWYWNQTKTVASKLRFVYTSQNFGHHWNEDSPPPTTTTKSVTTPPEVPVDLFIIQSNTILMKWYQSLTQVTEIGITSCHRTWDRTWQQQQQQQQQLVKMCRGVQCQFWITSPFQIHVSYDLLIKGRVPLIKTRVKTFGGKLWCWEDEVASVWGACTARIGMEQSCW